MTEWKVGDEVWFVDKSSRTVKQGVILQLPRYSHALVRDTQGMEHFLYAKDFGATQEECRKRQVRLLRAKANRREKKIEQLHHERAVLLRQIRELEG